MKKFLLGTVALIAMGTAATAADLGARPVYTKAPPIPVMNWTGFYIGAGGGYGMFDGDNNPNANGVPIPGTVRTGGRGYFGTVSGGYDWQINPTWVVGIFGDAQFGDIKGDISYSTLAFQGRTKNDLNYAAGVRVGYLIAPNVLSYVNGGYSHAEFKGADLFSFGFAPTGLTSAKAKYDGWFIGGGFEHTLNIFGISAPGWFLKTEYRLAEYNGKDIAALAPGGIPTGLNDNFKPYVQTISTQISYKFNWGR